MFVLFLMPSLVIPCEALSAMSAPQAIAQLNSIRAAHGLPSVVTESPTLSAGCAAHVRYMTQVGVMGHSEDAGNSAYTAEGNAAGHSSVLAAGGADGPQAWLDAPYHLQQLLSPRLSTSGYAGNSRYSCMTTLPSLVLNDYVAHSPQPGFYTYPGPEVTEHQFEQYSCHERPSDPATDAGLDCSSTGPIMIIWRMPDASLPVQPAGTPSAVTLTSNTANSVPVRLVSRGTTVVFGVPEKPLQPATWYTATATYPDTVHSWRFRTQGLPLNITVNQPSGVMYMSRHGVLRVGGEAASPQLSVNASNLDTGASIPPQPASPSRKLQEDWTASLPLKTAGRWRICASGGGAATAFAMSRECITSRIRVDQSRPSLVIGSAWKVKKSSGQRTVMVEAQGSDTETPYYSPLQCSYRYRGSQWLPCRSWLNYDIRRYRFPVSRRVRAIRIRITDPQGNSRTVIARARA